jgi:hypothetical protein
MGPHERFCVAGFRFGGDALRIDKGLEPMGRLSLAALGASNVRRHEYRGSIGSLCAQAGRTIHALHVLIH